jgi:radical SAM superfamily enzyme YgiQ (UPF0313 family)
MHYSSPIVRPPFEAKSVYLQVTKGCNHNLCKYCNYYKDVPYSISPMNEIIEDLKELKNKGYSFRRIWLLSADPFSLPFEKLLEIANLIHEYLPFVESIGSYSRVDSLKNKTVEELKQLKNAGYDSIVFGVESADDNILKTMNKGYDSKEITEELSKMDEAKFKYTLIFLNGLGGQNTGEHNAKKTAQLFNKFNPERIMINGLIINSNTPLMKDIKEGRFIPSKEKENIRELQTFLKELKIETFIDATNASMITPFFGKIPDNKHSITAHLNEITEKYDEKELYKKRIGKKRLIRNSKKIMKNDLIKI